MGVRMVKGRQRRVLHLKNPESGLFEEAFFFLKSSSTEESSCGARDMVAEANRILLGCRAGEAARRPRRRLAAFLLGVLCGAVLGAATLIAVGLIV